MENVIQRITQIFWPGLADMPEAKRLVGQGEVFGFLYSTPLALAGLIWLAAVTNPLRLGPDWPMLALLGILMFVFRKLGFFMIVEIRAGRYASSDGSLESTILWTALFIFGPVALWLSVFIVTFDFIWRYLSVARGALIDRWNRVRNFSFYLSGILMPTLLALEVYQRLVGQIPIAGLGSATLFPAVVAILVQFVLMFVAWSVYIGYAIWTQVKLTERRMANPVILFMFMALGLSSLAHPFAILLAGLYVVHGLATFLFLLVGLLLVAVLARQLSWAAESSRQQSRQLEKLELLSRAILSAPPDASTLPDLLREHVPAMFPSGRVGLWVEPGRFLLNYPEGWYPPIDEIMPWLEEQTSPRAFLMNEPLPWVEGSNDHQACLAAPILEVDTNRPIGGIYLEVFSLVSPWDKRSLQALFSAVLSLSAQVASALHQAQVYAQALAYQRVSQELTLAGRIQSSFLPSELPIIAGWQLAVTLLPARETSGDFFDLIPLEDGKLGIVIADVTDKGLGAALYMALSRTLIRTYAIEFDGEPQPEVVLFAANGRILHDASAYLFVTAFYGILDPVSGQLTYCNAGHNPPYLIKRRNGNQIELNALGATGMPMGIEEDTIWTKATCEVGPGDVLILYTDGIPDAQNAQGEFFQDQGLQEIAKAGLGLPADEIQAVIMDEVEEFTGEAPQFDDITLVVLSRDAELVPVTEPDTGQEPEDMSAD